MCRVLVSRPCLPPLLSRWRPRIRAAAILPYVAYFDFHLIRPFARSRLEHLHRPGPARKSHGPRLRSPSLDLILGRISPSMPRLRRSVSGLPVVRELNRQVIAEETIHSYSEDMKNGPLRVRCGQIGIYRFTPVKRRQFVQLPLGASTLAVRSLAGDSKQSRKEVLVMGGTNRDDKPIEFLDATFCMKISGKTPRGDA
jgi:hypothetical protein